MEYPLSRAERLLAATPAAVMSIDMEMWLENLEIATESSAASPQSVNLFADDNTVNEAVSVYGAIPLSDDNEEEQKNLDVFLLHIQTSHY